MKKTYNAWCFLIFIYIFFLYYSVYLGHDILDVLKHGNVEVMGQEIGQLYSSTDYARKKWINIYGLSQRLLGKDIIDDFSLYRTSYGKIISPRAYVEQDKADNAVNNIEVLYRYLEQQNIPVYYITSLLPISDNEKLPVGMGDYSHENADMLLNALNEIRIPVIDLRTSSKICEIPENTRFYKTDHHWRLETCYAAYVEIIERLEKDLGWNLSNDGMFISSENYNKLVKENCFLGSYGVKMGEWYIGKDDFVCLIPKWETDFSFEAYGSVAAYGTDDMIMKKEGDFTSALMDMGRVEDDDYYNKFFAFSNGYNIENRVINNMAKNDYKLLLISHSYGRPLTQYLSLSFKEVRNLDPQEGRYNKNYLEYIDEFKPDLVLVLTEFEGENINLLTFQ